MWLTLLPEAVPPSPKFQLKVYGAIPEVAEALKFVISPTPGLAGEKVMVP